MTRDQVLREIVELWLGAPVVPDGDPEAALSMSDKQRLYRLRSELDAMERPMWEAAWRVADRQGLPARRFVPAVREARSGGGFAEWRERVRR